jgi:DNA-binding response OmpR family regulator
MRILVAEDDPSIADVLFRELTRAHYCVDITSDGDTAIDMGWTNDYDLLILDILLPGCTGIEVCQSLRAEGLDTPILLLTALDRTSDIVAGLEHGADDYLTKPFDLGILMARVRSLTRRRTCQRTAEIELGSLTIDTAGRRALSRGLPMKLSSKEFALLEYLAMHAGSVRSNSSISEHVWDMTFDARSNVVESLVRSLRRRLESVDSDVSIRTIRGVGYVIETSSTTTGPDTEKQPIAQAA